MLNLTSAKIDFCDDELGGSFFTQVEFCSILKRKICLPNINGKKCILFSSVLLTWKVGIVRSD